MDAFERYIYLINRDGSSPTESSMNAGKRSLNIAFKTSPSYTLLTVNDIQTEAIVTNKSDFREKSILFRPDTKVDIGSVITFKNKEYLLTEFLDRELDPKGKLELCNAIVTVKIPGEEKYLGDDVFGNPVYEYTDETTKPIHAIAKTTLIDEERDQAINLSGDRISVTIPYVDFPYDKFEVYEETYVVKGIDRTESIKGVGLLTILGEKEQ